MELLVLLGGNILKVFFLSIIIISMPETLECGHIYQNIMSEFQKRAVVGFFVVLFFWGVRGACFGF